MELEERLKQMERDIENNVDTIAKMQREVEDQQRMAEGSRFGFSGRINYTDKSLDQLRRDFDELKGNVNNDLANRITVWQAETYKLKAEIDNLKMNQPAVPLFRRLFPIKKVGPYYIGRVVQCNGILARITSFPTRHTVCLENTAVRSTEWSSAKVSIRDIELSIFEPK
jgi:uncharacterized small protein (DUF1192 family)